MRDSELVSGMVRICSAPTNRKLGPNQTFRRHRDFSESFSSHFRNHKAPAFGLKIPSVLRYESWGRNTSLDAVNQHPRATDSAIGFGGSQIYSSQQYLAPQVHMDMAFHTDSLAKFFLLPEYDNSREH
jgi:hypothetical protein